MWQNLPILKISVQIANPYSVWCIFCRLDRVVIDWKADGRPLFFASPLDISHLSPTSSVRTNTMTSPWAVLQSMTRHNNLAPELRSLIQIFHLSAQGTPSQT